MYILHLLAVTSVLRVLDMFVIVDLQHYLSNRKVKKKKNFYGNYNAAWRSVKTLRYLMSVAQVAGEA